MAITKVINVDVNTGDANAELEKLEGSFKEVAKKCINAGLDHEMISTTYIKNLENLLVEGQIKIDKIDRSCYRMLYLKYKLGLFDNPYKNIYDNPKQY